jgi:hypothetical protein
MDKDTLHERSGMRSPITGVGLENGGTGQGEKKEECQGDDDLGHPQFRPSAAVLTPKGLQFPEYILGDTIMVIQYAREYPRSDVQ